MDDQHPTTCGGRLVKRGDTRDPECHRTSHRLRVAQAILADLGIEATWQHGPRVGLVGTGLMAREGHLCDGRCVAVWPEWVTGETFDVAYRLADETQAARGAWHQRQINEARRVREAQARCIDCNRLTDQPGPICDACDARNAERLAPRV